jgi:DNA-binding MarR family transcriptional regulator
MISFNPFASIKTYMSYYTSPFRNFLKYPMWMLVMLKINNRQNMSQLAKDTGFTYSHLYKIVMILRKGKFLSVRKSGRIDEVRLTARGKELKATIEKVCSMVKIYEKN